MKIIKINPVFIDKRGSIWDFLTNEEIHHVGFLISKKNSIRGKHYHKEQKQYTLVLKGKVKIISKNLLEKDSKIEEFELNEMEMLEIPPYYYHSIESLKDSECLILTSKGRQGYDYENDTIRIDDPNSYKIEDLTDLN